MSAPERAGWRAATLPYGMVRQLRAWIGSPCQRPWLLMLLSLPSSHAPQCVRCLVGFRPHRLERHRKHVMFAASQLASRGASNAAPSQRVCALGIVLCPTHVALLLTHHAHDQPKAVLTDFKRFMTVLSNWVGEGKDPHLRHSFDGDILARIIKVLHKRVDLELLHYLH